MEKIPSNFYDNNITNIFKKISSFFAENICEENYILNKQYQDHILMNEQILFKFHYKEQNEIIESMSHFIQNTKTGRKKHLSLDIFKIIKILLHLDEKKNQLFCCKNHADFFIENKGIMEPELYVRLNPIKELLTHLFKEYKKYCMDQKDLAKEEGKELFQIITMLTIDISPCLQKIYLKPVGHPLPQQHQNCFLQGNLLQAFSFCFHHLQLIFLIFFPLLFILPLINF